LINDAATDDDDADSSSNHFKDKRSDEGHKVHAIYKYSLMVLGLRWTDYRAAKDQLLTSSW